jgi:hypothetical protein
MTEHLVKIPRTYVTKSPAFAHMIDAQNDDTAEDGSAQVVTLTFEH